MKKTVKKTQETAELEVTVRELYAVQEKINQLKESYKKYDELLDKITKIRSSDFSVNEYNVRLIDNFAKKNTAFKATFIRRFDAEIERKAA